MRLFLAGIITSLTMWAQAPAPAPAGDIVGVGNFSHIVRNLDKSLEGMERFQRLSLHGCER
jgi:hypothetical protein